MNLQLVFFSTFIFTSMANIENDFILDYFKHKKLSSVVGFSCNIEEDNMSLVKRFNKIGISASLKKLNYEYQIHRFAYTNYWKLGVFFDLRCSSSENITSIFSDATEYRMYDELHHWLVLGSSVNDTLYMIDDKAFNLSTDFVIAVPSTATSTDRYELYDAYNIWKDRGAILNVTFFGSWNERDQIKVFLKDEKFLRRANMHGMTVKASFFSSKYKPPNMTLEDYLQDYASRSRDGLSKFGFIIVKHLSDMFNFNLKSGTVAKWEVGDSTGPILRALYNGEIDITGSPATMNVKRTYMVKYVHQSWPFRTCFIFRSPQPQNIKINEILRPLEIQVWYLTALLFLLGMRVMASVFQYENEDSNFMRYSTSFVIICGAICQQGTDAQMNNISTRIAFLSVMIFSLLFYNYYSASVVSARLNEPIFKLNDSLSELAKTNLKVASEWMVYFELFIKKKDWETVTFYTKKWMQVPQTDQFMQPEKAMSLVQRGGFAYHVHPDVGYPIVNRLYDNKEICELTEVHLAQPTYSTFAVNFNSTFVEMMRVGLTKISEVGLRHRQVLRWTTQKPRCLKNILSASSLNIFEFAPHLFILLIGMSLAVIICILEFSESKIQTIKRKILNFIKPWIINLSKHK